ncbi:MAG TPA: HAMP domain-containing sensor histidine kinase [Candidatus Krumholzibacteria bacterium]|nr:HAMP domain-containing sensor histidine kinase [Candidatus Krumholzibacteria bacterium]
MSRVVIPVRAGGLPVVAAGRPLHPARLAVAAAAVYTVSSTVYIRLSSRWAAAVAGSVENLARLEQYKGSVFVVVTGLLIFAIAYALLRLVKRRDEALLRSRDLAVASERVATAGIFASSLAHDINNILTVVQCNLEILEAHRDLSDDDRRLIHDSRHSCERLAVFARRLMASARERAAGESVPVDIVPLVREAVDFASSHTKVRQRNLSVSLPTALVATANGALLTRAVLNLVVNAADATGPAGRIEVTLAARDGRAELRVEDDGPGVDPEVAERIFEPFVTTKPDGNGLGLLSVRSCAQEAGGRAQVARSRLGGAAFLLALPLAASGPGTTAPAS